MAIKQEILEYVQKNILPVYESFDKAHNLEHVNKVIKNSMQIAVDYDVDIDMVYVIAAYHDVGLPKGRKDHERHSAEIMLADETLKKWFAENALAQMAEAIEDHRASSDRAPRSIYGKIVAEADRDIEYTTIITRVIQYSLEHYHDHTPDQHYTRCCEHVQEKYGENGYLKLWLNTEGNKKNLQKLRDALADGEVFRNDFLRTFDKLCYNPQM